MDEDPRQQDPRAGICSSLRELEDRLKQHIVGQDEAVARRGRRHPPQPRRHLPEAASPCRFIFVGSTGVGKTELVKVLANELFDSLDSADPAGYVGVYGEALRFEASSARLPAMSAMTRPGQLTEKIRRKPYSVILFDELEKAHPDVLNILLQILDDGAHDRRAGPRGEL